LPEHKEKKIFLGDLFTLNLPPPERPFKNVSCFSLIEVIDQAAMNGIRAKTMFLSVSIFREKQKQTNTTTAI
jgi:hypothetical protein